MNRLLVVCGAGLLLVTLTVTAFAAMAGSPSSKDRQQARAVIQKYAVAFAVDDGKAACALLTSQVRQQYVDFARSRGSRKHKATCARGFSKVRAIDLDPHVGRPQATVFKHQTSGARRILGFVNFGGRSGFGFEVDVAKVQSRWQIYAENFCNVPDDCPPPPGT